MALPGMHAPYVTVLDILDARFPRQQVFPELLQAVPVRSSQSYACDNDARSLHEPAR
jgi:hypothetical protein